MAAHQHNYSSLRYPGWPLDEGQVLYSNARRGGASEHEPKGRRGCRTPGPTEEEVEGCRLTVGTRDVVGYLEARRWKDNREDTETSL